MKIAFPPIPGSCLVLASLMMLSQAFTTVEGKPAEKADKEPDCFICQLLVCFNNKYGGLVAVLMALPKGGGVVVGGLHVNVLLI